MSEKIKVICIVGPTASGKTDLGVYVAKKLNGEVVSADSMQIYKNMHIASAAADEEEMQGVKHHLLEFLPYGSTYSVSDYVAAARKTINDIAARGKTPIVVGGTGLYINSLADNINFVSADTDYELRKRLTEEAARLGGEKMLERLREKDKSAAEKLHPNDTKRIVRALEIIETANTTKTEQDKLSKSQENPYDFTLIGITFADREKLYDRINRRVDLMLQRGLLDEAKAAYENRNTSGGGAAAIGHKELFPVFETGEDITVCAERIKQSTRRYAKRQLTWFRARNDINWVYKDTEDVYKKTDEILKQAGIL